MVACMVYFPTWKPIKLNHPWIGKYTRQSWIRKMGFLTTTHRHLSPKKKNIVGGFKPPLWKICDRQNGWTSSPNFRGEHEKYLKPPTQKNIGTPAKKTIAAFHWPHRWTLHTVAPWWCRWSMFSSFFSFSGKPEVEWLRLSLVGYFEVGSGSVWVGGFFWYQPGNIPLSKGY